MIRCEVIENFNLKDYDKIKIVERKGADIKGQLNKGDIFECDENMARYLTGENDLKKVVVEIIEVKEEIKVNKELVKPLEEVPKEDELTKEEIKHYTSKKKKSSKK